MSKPEHLYILVHDTVDNRELYKTIVPEIDIKTVPALTILNKIRHEDSAISGAIIDVTQNTGRTIALSIISEPLTPNQRLLLVTSASPQSLELEPPLSNLPLETKPFDIDEIEAKIRWVMGEAHNNHGTTTN
jgi:hypothetical protein